MAYVYDLVKGLSAPNIEGVDAGKLSRYARQGRYEYVYDTPGTRERVCAVAQRLMEQRGFTLSQLATYIIETWAPIAEDMRRVYERLASDGFVVPHGLDPRSGQQLEPQHKPQEPNPIYTEIRGLIASGEYAQAISKYYEALGDKPYGELHQELLYLKRLANVELSGRDLLAFRSESSRDDVIKNNIWEYCSCIESVLATFNSAGRASPLEILVVSVPKTMEELNERILRELNKRVSLRDGELRRLTTTMTGYIHGTFACPKGRLFDQYPNPLIYHWLREETRDVLHYPALWTTYSPSFIQEEILGKGLSLVGIDAYGHSSWRIRSSKKREPDFTSLESLKDIEVSHYGVSGMRYTGRTHEISGKSFYEIDLLTGIPWRKERNFPPLEELAEEVLREAENLLRERHGLPRIGEGWVSEMQLYYYCVINFLAGSRSLRRPGSRGALPRERARAESAAWQWTPGYAVAALRGEPRGTKRRGSGAGLRKATA